MVCAVLHHEVVLTIAVSGPQGSGKTTLAMALGQSLGVPVFSRDPLMTVLLEGGMPLNARGGLKAVPVVGLELQTALLRRQLKLGSRVSWSA
jgi:predicted kinase